MTVDRAFAERIIAGNGFLDGDDTPAPSNPRVVLIVRYVNAWGREAFGCVFEGQADKYTESPTVRDPQPFWWHEAPKAVPV